MAQLPEIARVVLKGMKPSEAHPEAGQLAAFAEQALPQQQRDSVLNHLSACADCREVVNLSMPPLEDSAQALSASPARSWSFWESLRRAPVRWAGVAATAAVVTAAVWVGQMNDPATPLPNEAHIFRAEPQPAWSTPEADEGAAAPKVAATSRSSQRYLLDPQAITAPPFSAQSEAVANSPVSHSGDSEAAAQAMSMAAAARDSRQSLDTAGPPTTMAANNRVTAEPPTSDNRLWATGILTSGPGTTSSRTTGEAAEPQWMISPDGTLRRSLDQSQTWQDHAAPLGARLKAVSAAGSDVWVGGAEGVLYHSGDSGLRWHRVIPVSPTGHSFSGDVVSIEFSSSQHGTVLSSTGERWTTVDGGRTWGVR